MDATSLLQLCREALLLTVLLSAPVVLASLVVGLLVSLFQATTQLQDHTLSFVPKVIAVVIVLMLTGPWIGAHLVRFTTTLLQSIPLWR